MAGWQRYLDVVDTVPGWFPAVDQSTFVTLLVDQETRAQPGDLLEIGVFQGQSAILLGYFAESADRRLIACDVFDEVAVGDANSAENALSYADLSKDRFMQQWRRFHPDSRLDLQVCLSSDLHDRVPAGSLRFLHLDGSHLYDVVGGDITLARSLLAPGGILVLDDYRSPHTPGVAAATWQAVHEGGLWPFRLTPQKMYAAFDRATAALGRALFAGDAPAGFGLLSETVGHREFDVLYPLPEAPAGPELPRKVLTRAGGEIAGAVRDGAAGLWARRRR